MIIAGADNHPPMLEKYLYDSWKSRMEHYMENRENGRMILSSVQNGPLIWPTVTEEDGTTRTKTYEVFSVTKKLQADCDCKDTNIVLQGILLDVYANVNHHKVSKEIWDRVMLLMQGTKFSLQEKECLTIPVFNPRDDPIFCLNKAMAFLTIEAGQILDEKQLAFLVDPGILDSQAAQTTILNNAAFQTEDLDAYDSDCDDVSNAQSVLMANLFSFGYDVLSEDFGKRFVPQQELSVEQAFWFNMSNSSIESFVASPVKVEAPRELAKEQADILQGIVEQAKAKQPLDNALDFACCPDCSLVSGLWMLKTYDKESLSAHELPRLQSMTPLTSSSGLVSNPIPQQPYNPPKRDDWDRLFQPMFDEYFNPPTIVVSLVQVVVAPRAVDIADS
nr:hypothetical protein [Tanacetum cinerariifolium]